MRRYFSLQRILLSAFAAALLLFPSAGAQAPRGDNDVTVAVIGASRVSLPGSPVPPGYLKIIDEINLIKPDLCMHTGDLIFGYYDTDDQLKDEYRQAFTVLARLSPKTCVVPGNNDYHSPLSIAQFRRYSREKDYFSFDYNGVRCIVLNTELPRQEGTIGGDQRRWLVRELEKARGARAVFVFMHRPLFSPLDPAAETAGPRTPETSFAGKKERDEVADLLARYRVTAVFSGHENLYSKTDYKGIPFYTVGGAGAPPSTAPDKGGFLSYLLVTVSSATVTTKLIEPYRLFAAYRTPSNGEKAAAEVEIDNTVSEDPGNVLTLRGIRFTVPRGSYTVTAETVAPREALRRFLGDSGFYRAFGFSKDVAPGELDAAIPRILAPAIYRTEPNRSDKTKLDLWIRANSPGSLSYRLQVVPRQ